jgi:hypothetical protein
MMCFQTPFLIGCFFDSCALTRILLGLAVARLTAVLSAGPSAANRNFGTGLKLVLSVGHNYFSGLYTL